MLVYASCVFIPWQDPNAFYNVVELTEQMTQTKGIKFKFTTHAYI